MSERPTTADSLEARRAKVVQAAEAEGKSEPKPSEIDVWPLVVKHNIRNDDDRTDAVDKLIRVARDSCSPAFVKYLFKIEAKLPSLIEQVWRWETVDDRLLMSERSREEALYHAFRSDCVCGGVWPQHVAHALLANRIDFASLGHDIYRSLLAGRSESTPVVTLAGLQGGEGKSLIFYPMDAVFGDRFVHHHVAAGTFALLGLEGKRVVVLDEWDFRAHMAMGLQLLWFEGKPVPITRPQDHFCGHVLYKGSAPIFVTMPLRKLEAFFAEAEAAKRAGTSSEATMLLRRLNIYRFTQPVKKPSAQIPKCAHCFASFLFQSEHEYQSRA